MVMRKLFLWAGLGFFGILFVGPVVAVVAAVLPFVLLGFLIWLPIHLVSAGPDSRAWPSLGRARQECRRTAAALYRASAAVAEGCRPGETLRAAGRVLGTVLLEAFCGAAVGAVLGLLSDLDRAHNDPPPAAVVGALLGAAVGVLVGLSRLRAAQPARG
jgi:hypothetical protein